MHRCLRRQDYPKQKFSVPFNACHILKKKKKIPVSRYTKNTLIKILYNDVIQIFILFELRQIRAMLCTDFFFYKIKGKYNQYNEMR